MYKPPLALLATNGERARGAERWDERMEDIWTSTLSIYTLV